ncbi:hypothetical protein BBJ28_00018684 [Nothophytophthora sp. Chile5]|nr:hypothetical protein BBJ28_00018684 [Nothophytophthora sp. Chile5]
MAAMKAHTLVNDGAQTTALRGLLSLLPAQDNAAEHEWAALSLVVHFRHLRGAERCQKVRQALEALTELEHYSLTLQRYPLVKQAFWEQVLASDLMFGGAANHKQELRLQHEAFPRLVLDFSRLKPTAELLALLAEFFASPNAAVPPPRPAFFGVTSETCVIPTRNVRVGLRFVKCRLTAETMKLLRPLLLPPSKENPSSSGTPGGRKMSTVRYSVSSLDLSENALNATEMMQLAELLTEINRQRRSRRGSEGSLALEELVLEKVVGRSLTTESWTAFRALVSAAFGISPSLSEPRVSWSSSGASLKRLSLARNSLSYHHLACICSALRYGATCLEELSLAHSFSLVDPADRVTCWQWLAIGLRPFLPGSVRSGLRRLDLSGNPLFPQDSEAWLQCLGDPLTTVLHWTGASEPHARPLQNADSAYCVLSNSVELNSAPNETSPRLRIIEQELQAAMETARQGSSVQEWEVLGVTQEYPSWVCVVIPGFGVAWTQAKHVTPGRQSAVRSSAVISELVMNDMTASPTTMEALERFVGGFGGQLQLLELRRNALSATDLHAILVGCEQLQHLDVEGCRLLRMQLLVDALHGNLGQHLLTLNLNGNLVGANAASMLAITLSGQAQGQTPVLQELRLAHNEIGVDGVRHLHTLLDTNKKLTLLELDLPNEGAQHDDHGYVQLYRTRCMRLDVAFQNELAGVAPLALNRKLAFLLVLSAQEVVLDRGVVSLIFRLAADERRRRIIWTSGHS